ncbi:CaiB/BaiF CoA-transferase family protein [Variovorax ureilyticus]|uniref:CaiB/BaiF CoA-transferase family protein n=1 Tax=Variovorax ureilyticus TaxID=1836198 RepID=A0ABU8VPM2_9BURK
MSEAFPKPLDGLRVLSFCHYLQGPAAGQYLADMGADVVKVEPLEGAFERRWAGADTFVGETSAFFLCGNRNKRSLAVDAKNPEGLALLLRLVQSFDVVLENFRPGVMEKLGLGFEAIKKVKPDIIYASASGFGPDGPARNDPGQDLLVQARSGLIAATGNGSVAVGCAAVDQHGAALLAMGILGAYVRRLRTGAGTRVEASLFNAGIDLQAEALTLYYSGQRRASDMPRDPHLATWFHAAPYGVYRLADGAQIVLSLSHLQTVAAAIGCDAVGELAQRDPYLNRDIVANAVSQALARFEFATLAAALDEAGVWYQRVQNYDELRADPQVQHNGTFFEVPIGDDAATLVQHPLRFDGSHAPLRHLALKAGQHTAEVLREMQLSDSEIAGLSERGVVRLAF